MKKVLLLVLATVTLVSFSQCSKDGDGEVGPKGEQGEQGPKGDKGTANVIYSDWITVKKADWAMKQVGSYEGKPRYELDAPEVTSEIIKNGTVMVYRRLNESSTTVSPLPDFLDGFFVFNFLLKKGKIILQFQATDHKLNTTSDLFDSQFRYVIIPGGVKARRSAPLLDFNDYDAVTEYYGIPK